MMNIVKTSKWPIILWTQVLAWLALIAFLSFQTGEDTTSLSYKIVLFFADVWKWVFRRDIDAEVLHMYLRKAAHIALFLVLGLLFTGAVSLTRLKRPYIAAISVAACLLVAVASEYLKTFIPGRHCQWDEALLNFAAALVGIGVILLWKRSRESPEYSKANERDS